MTLVEHPYTVHWQAGDVKIIACESCGFLHVDPIPDAAQLREFYEKRYYQQVKPFDYRRVTDEFVQKQAQLAEQNAYFGSIYAKLAAHLDGPADGPGALLDIGSGNNLLAVHFLKRGWRCTAIEPNVEAADYLRKYGLEVVEQFVDDLSFLESETFDVVNLQFVLEHMANPANMLKEVWRVLKPGGLVRVSVPNDFTEGQLAYREYYRHEGLPWVQLPDHINYFNFESLSSLLSRCGFREVHRTTGFPLEFLLLGGVDYYRGKEDHGKVNPFVTQFQQAFIKTGRRDVLERLYEALAHLGMGRAVFMIAKKAD